MTQERRFNTKRKIRTDADQSHLEALAVRVVYRGSPYHKRVPGDFGLTPPAEPRLDKTLCDIAGNIQLAKAQLLLRQGVRRGLISVQERGGLPQNIWAVADGIPLEAQLENEGNAS